MHPTGPKAFDVFELDDADGAIQSADEVLAGSTRSHPGLDRFSARLQGVPRSDRRAVLATVIALAVSGLASTKAAQSHPRIHHVTRTNVVAAPVVAVDALGCPRGRQCDTLESPALVLAAGRAALPSGRITYAMMEPDRESGAIYRIELSMSAAHTTIQVVSVCVPGAAPVLYEPIAVTLTRTDTSVPADLPTPAGLKEWTITLASSRPGDASCGVNVTAESTLTQGIDGRAIDTVVNLLADDPRLMAVT